MNAKQSEQVLKMAHNKVWSFLDSRKDIEGFHYKTEIYDFLMKKEIKRFQKMLGEQRDFIYVLCDLCSRDYSDSEAKGGFLFSSTAVCPECAPEFRKTVERNGEQVSGECPEGMSFREWVLSLR